MGVFYGVHKYRTSRCVSFIPFLFLSSLTHFASNMSKDQFEDEDFLLSQLTAEEIAELSEMIDPDVSQPDPKESIYLLISRTNYCPHQKDFHLKLQRNLLVLMIGSIYWITWGKKLK